MITYKALIGGWTYWIRKRKNDKYALFVGDTLLLESHNMDDIHAHLKEIDDHFSK